MQQILVAGRAGLHLLCQLSISCLLPGGGGFIARPLHRSLASLLLDDPCLLCKHKRPQNAVNGQDQRYHRMVPKHSCQMISWHDVCDD